MVAEHTVLTAIVDVRRVNIVLALVEQQVSTPQSLLAAELRSAGVKARRRERDEGILDQCRSGNLTMHPPSPAATYSPETTILTSPSPPNTTAPPPPHPSPP